METKKQRTKQTSYSAAKSVSMDTINKRGGKEIRTPDYLSYCHLNGKWSHILTKTLSQYIKEQKQLLIDHDLMNSIPKELPTTIDNPNHEEEKEETSSSANITRLFGNKSIDSEILQRDWKGIKYPKIELSAKKDLYKIMNIMGTDVITQYAEHRKRSGRGTISYVNAIQQFATTHGVKKTAKMVKKYKKIRVNK